MREVDEIRKIAKWVGTPGRHTPVGIGDDAAVIRVGPQLIATVDSLVEGVHFDLAYFTPQDVGRKALAVNLSDIAAMGARPVAALVSLAIPSKQVRRFLPGFYKGLARLARQAGTAIVGGNLSQSPRGIFVDVTLLGHPLRRPLLRSGARVGDWIGVLGELGESAAGLELLQKKGRRALRHWPRLCRAQLNPTPLLAAGAWLGRTAGATSLTDVSDGLTTDLTHLCESSKRRFRVHWDWLVPSRALQKAASALSKPLSFYLRQGGEDYALLFTTSQKGRQHIDRGLPGVRWIGRVEAGPKGLFDSLGRPIQAAGYDHFASS